MIGLYKRPPAPMPADTAICWFSWSDYYHASWIEWDGDKSEYEAKPFKGVCHSSHWGANAAKGSIIHLYDFNVPLTASQHDKVIAGLEAELGKGYDYAGIMGFLFRRNFASPNRWFCSEYVDEKVEDAGIVLVNDRKPFQVWPEILAMSTVMHPVGQIVVGGPDLIKPIPSPKLAQGFLSSILTPA